MANEDHILDAPENHGNQKEDELHFGLKALAFCIPISGAIMYFAIDGNRFPNKRGQACTAALWGVGLGIVLRVIITLMEL